MPIEGEKGSEAGEAGRPTGHGRAEKRPAAAAKLALWPGYGLAQGKSCKHIANTDKTFKAKKEN